MQFTTKSIKDPKELFDYLKQLSLHEMQYEFDKLIAIKQWAKDQLPIKDGDKIELHDFAETDSTSGWWIYREALREGATGIAKHIEFNNHYKFWYADVILDKLWSVSDWNGELRRFDYEGDNRGTFCFNLKYLRKITGEK